MTDLQTTKLDRMRYTKDKNSANLVLLAIFLDALYFVSVYQSDVGDYYYNWSIGASVIYNLLFMLIAFLSSEGVKSRKGSYNPVLIFIGIMQFVRIFYLPGKAHSATVELGGQATPVMSDGQYLFLVVCLVGSGICCLAGAISSIIHNRKLAQYLRKLN